MVDKFSGYGFKKSLSILLRSNHLPIRFGQELFRKVLNEKISALSCILFKFNAHALVDYSETVNEPADKSAGRSIQKMSKPQSSRIGKKSFLKRICRLKQIMNPLKLAAINMGDELRHSHSNAGGCLF